MHSNNFSCCMFLPERVINTYVQTDIKKKQFLDLNALSTAKSLNRTQTDRREGRQTDKPTGRQTDRQADRHTDRQKGRQTDRQADTQTDRLADRHTYTYAHRFAMSLLRARLDNCRNLMSLDQKSREDIATALFLDSRQC